MEKFTEPYEDSLTVVDAKESTDKRPGGITQDYCSNEVTSNEVNLSYYDTDKYNMTGNKYLIVFNHYKFAVTKHFYYQEYKKRDGTFNDVARLQETFENVGFKVTVHNDLNYDKIMDCISEFLKQDHTDTSCVAIAILTHGKSGGRVCASDRPYELSDVIKPFQNNPKLAGKPKLFFIQACRGNKSDEGHRIHLDGNGRSSILIPAYADWLVLYSSNEDHVSFRDSQGSWMMQNLCNVINEKRTDMDLLRMVTLVNRRVASRETVTFDPRLQDKKQIPETRFTLTKFLYL